MPDIVKELGHEGRKLDLFKIDCEGCEWDTFGDWLNAGVDIGQIMVELHWRDNAPRVQEFYKALQDHGYVVFNKEPNTLGCGGDCVEYSFLKLDPAFSKMTSSRSNILKWGTVRGDYLPETGMSGTSWVSSSSWRAKKALS